MTEINFVQAIRDGIANPEDVDDWVHDWHSNVRGLNMDLHEFLGMTVQQYYDFVTDPDILDEILAEQD